MEKVNFNVYVLFMFSSSKLSGSRFELVVISKSRRGSRGRAGKAMAPQTAMFPITNNSPFLVKAPQSPALDAPLSEITYSK